ncbi:MAG: PTS sugar transporter subunit IIB [Eubacteriales bacterium]|nr:PTS sugar transporter subunit IIB [Eubacteriales bacterium]
MNVTVFRIDDRLIHGQIVTAWLQYADANQIVVVDDDAAKNAMRQQLLRMATPKDILLQVLTIEEGKKRLKDDSTDNTLLLVGNASTALALVDKIENLNSINVGNQNMKKGKQKILDNFWLFQEDIEAFQALKKKGIRCEFRTVPNDQSKDAYELLNRL